MNNTEIIAVGTELLMGETLDTNSHWLATRLPELGLTLQFITQVRDDKRQLSEALILAKTRSEYIITIGGLGPTQDDLTRESIAEVLKEPLAIDLDIEGKLRQYFRARGMEFPTANRKQAAFIPSSSFLMNYYGTAPGWWVRKDDAHIISLPGPPPELEAMWINVVEPFIKRLRSKEVILTRTFKTLGLSESKLDELIGELHKLENPYIGTYAKADGVQIRLIGKGKSKKEVENIIEPVATRLESLLGDYIWGTNDDTLEGMIIDILNSRKLTVSIAECVSGGYIQNKLSQSPKSDICLLGGILLSSNKALVGLGVDDAILKEYGVASLQVAESTAHMLIRHFGSDVALSLVGEFGFPEDGAKMGTFYLCAIVGKKTHRTEIRIPLRKDIFRRRVAAHSLLFLYQSLVQN